MCFIRATSWPLIGQKRTTVVYGIYDKCDICFIRATSWPLIGQNRTMFSDITNRKQTQLTYQNSIHEIQLDICLRRYADSSRKFFKYKYMQSVLPSKCIVIFDTNKFDIHFQPAIVLKLFIIAQRNLITVNAFA